MVKESKTYSKKEYDINLNYPNKSSDNQNVAIISHYAITGHSVYHKEAVAEVKKLIQKEYDVEDINSVVAESALQSYLYKLNDIPFPGPEKEKFTFIDLFAGIGGFRIAMQDNGGKCIFSSEYDKYAQQTYFANYGEVPFGDITKNEVRQFIPKKFDVLCGGFPCQPFSIAGVSKKNSLGRKHGFDDEKQGNLFFHVADIIEQHRPKAFFLENVKNLVTHDKGNTFKVIKSTIEELGYSFDKRVLDGKHFAPQHRERTIMVGFDKKVFGSDIKFDFDRVDLPEANHKIKEILDSKVDSKYTLSDKLWNYLQEYAKKHKANGNGFGFGLVDLNGISRTISARYYKDGAEILIPQKGKNPRRLTPHEAARLQGYPDNFRIVVSDNQAYKQFGNSVVMPLIRAVGKEIVNIIKNGKHSH